MRGDTRLRPPPAGCADRRSAFPGGRCHLREWRCLCLAASCGGAAMRRPLACGQPCRPEVGVAGGAGPHRENWPEVGVPVPAGPFHLLGYVPRREPFRRLGSSPPRPCGPRCRPPPGELARGRPFQAYAPRAEPGVSLYRLSASDAGRVHRSGSRCPRSTTPYHGSRNPYRFRSASRLSIQREPNRTRLPNRKLFAPDGE